MKRIVNGALAWVVFAALGSALFWFVAGPQVATGQSGGITNFDTVVLGGDLIVGDDGTFGGDLSVSGAIVAAEFITAEGDVIIPGSLIVSDSISLNGSLTDGNSAVTIADNAIVDGAADAIQLTVQGHSAQTANPNIFIVENSGGTDAFQVSATGYVTTTQDLKVGDDLAVTDDATVGGILSVSEWLRLPPQGTITLTMNGTLTPTGSFQPITSAGGVSVSGANITTGGSGGVLVLYNIGGQTITFTETTGLISAGNIVLGTKDAAVLIRQGTDWVQIAASNN